jgi:putative tryptophan/tyrosine transport system substrate-binding protein
MRWIGLALLLSFAVASVGADAQVTSKTPRIGVLHLVPPSDTFGGLRKGLQELGYVDGQHIHLDYRWPESGPAGYSSLARQLVESKVDVIVAISSGAARAAKRATDTIPIVLCAVGEDPVKAGFVSSLARPGSNVTGTVTLAVELEAKRLELLNEAVPGLSRAAVFWDPKGPGQRAIMPDVQAAARRLNIRLVPVDWKGAGGIEKAFELARRERAGGVLALTSPEIWREQERIAQIGLKHRLPTAGMEPGFAEAGNLIQYGPDRTESCRRAAHHVDRILKGARPADLPIEQSTKFELVVNLKTARALNLTIPQTLLQRADQLIP